MTVYAALLRGIMPMNPNMRGEKLRGVFESLGFKNVSTVIASGNVVFESNSKNESALEEKIEKGLLMQLGFKSTTMVRSRDELQRLVKKDPFKKMAHTSQTYLIVTFFKHKQKTGAREIATVVDLATGRTPEFMRTVEKKFGKDITTRTWKTIGRILKKMEVMPSRKV
jgi:uncharacterized protein (DUF1697 family)